MKKQWILLVFVPILLFLSACQSEADKAFKDFKSEDETVRNAAIEKVAHMDPPPIDTLLNIVCAPSNQKEVSAQMKECAVQTLIKIGDSAIEPTLKAYRQYCGGTIPEGITNILMSLKNEKIISYLSDIIQHSPDTDLNSIQASTLTLAEIGGPQASDVIYGEFLKRAVNRPDDSDYNSTVIQAMGMIGDDRAIGELFKVITDDGYVKKGRYNVQKAKYVAFDALAQNPKCLDELCQFYRQYANDPDETKKNDAIYAKSLADKLFENKFKSANKLFKDIPLDSGIDNTIKPGKLVVLYKYDPPLKDSDGDDIILSTNLDTYLFIPEAYRCEIPQEAETIAFITSYTTKCGTYDDSADAYSLTACVTVVDVKTKNVIAKSEEFISSPPAVKNHSGPGTGSMPTDQIMEFVNHLYSDQAPTNLD